MPSTTVSRLLWAAGVIAAVTFGLGLAAPRSSVAQRGIELDETGRSAVYVLRDARRVNRDGQYAVMLQSLRQLRDPGLSPFFAMLAADENPILKLHGLLGLAECSTDRRIDLARIASVRRPEVQAALVGAALDNDLLTTADAAQMMTWRDLDPGVKLAAATQLVGRGVIEDTQFIREAATSDNLARAALASVMLLQMQDPAARAAVEQLDRSTSRTRDAARMVALQTALRYGYEHVGPYAMRIAGETNIDQALDDTALQAALRFRAPGAERAWAQRYRSSTDAARKLRLALLALRVSPWVSPELFAPLLAEPGELTQLIARAGQAVASGREVVANVVRLVEADHRLTTTWALSYAREHAEPDAAVRILVAVILSYEPAPTSGGGRDLGRTHRLDAAVAATQILAERSPQKAGSIIRAIIEQENTSPELVQGMLLGLIRSNSDQAFAAAADHAPFADARTDSLRVLLLAKHDQPLTEADAAILQQMVRGGGQPSPSLRAQAAWTYLRRTGQTGQALAMLDR